MVELKEFHWADYSARYSAEWKEANSVALKVLKKVAKKGLRRVGLSGMKRVALKAVLKEIHSVEMMVVRLELMRAEKKGKKKVA